MSGHVHPAEAALTRDDVVRADPIAFELAHVLAEPTGTSSKGFPFLEPSAYARFRDRVPHILAMGPRALHALELVQAAARRHGLDVDAAAKVVKGCVLTAAITAPSDLWLLRYVLGTLAQVGLTHRALEGEALDPAATDVERDGRRIAANRRELLADLGFVLSRGLLEQDEAGRFVRPRDPHAQGALGAFTAPPSWPADVSRLWARAFAGVSLEAPERKELVALGRSCPSLPDTGPRSWLPTGDEIEAGAHLLPVVLGLRAAGKHTLLASGIEMVARSLSPADREVGEAALTILVATGVAVRDGEAAAPTACGRRIGDKGAGPMGIIEAYHPYLARLDTILIDGQGGSWVTRGANIAASQDANRESFTRANDALDAFCKDTGFTPRVFIEHAIGRGEATRQRYSRPGGRELRYFGADLEDAAIDACLEEQRAGRLPAGMVFVRNADIGEPARLIDAIRAAGADPQGAVMIVGNGFHEVRGQTDERMVEVLRGYADAGIILSFTEESALSIDDLLATAWNTYHAGFRYVHEKSGQGLRPAEAPPPSRFPLAKSWHECTALAGYLRAERYSSRSRTIYPTAPHHGHNPSISANHFCVPRAIAERLGLAG
ncbi:MAG: hypothetical protein HYS27_10025 [Deltaproteobacteria bacterium]|nr:hypothetical protein [Deltaproteobacteria bacterium]